MCPLTPRSLRPCERPRIASPPQPCLCGYTASPQKTQKADHPEGVKDLESLRQRTSLFQREPQPNAEANTPDDALAPERRARED
jgi:hypothetical protein